MSRKLLNLLVILAMFLGTPYLSLTQYGSVNAAPDHFHSAVSDLAQAYARWGDHITALITNRHEFTDFESALQPHGQDEIKTVVEWKNA